MPSGRFAGKTGFTLVEVVVTLASIGIMAGAFLSINTILRTAKLSTVIRQVNSIRDAADKYVEASGAVNYTALNSGGVTTLINRGYLPSSIAQPGLTPLGVTYATGAGGDNTRLVITISNLPTSVQRPLANSLGRYGNAMVLGGSKVQVVF